MLQYRRALHLIQNTPENAMARVNLNFHDGQKRRQQSRNDPTPSAEVQLAENGSLSGYSCEQQSTEQRAECLSSSLTVYMQKLMEIGSHRKENKFLIKRVIYLLGHRNVHIDEMLPVSSINEYVQFFYAAHSSGNKLIDKPAAQQQSRIANSLDYRIGGIVLQRIRICLHEK